MAALVKEDDGTIKNVRNEDNLFRTFIDNITGKTSKDLALKNYDLQKQMFDYQVQLNQKQMEREDTAYQRAVKDANAAGLSSLSVGNGASSSSLSSGDAPQINDYAANNFTNGLNLLNTLNTFQNNITQQILQNKKQNAEINKINAETNAIDRENQYFDYTIDKKKIMFDNDFSDSLIKKAFNDKYGFFNDSDFMEKYAILGKLSPEAYSEAIMSNQFSNLGVILGLVSKIGNAFSNGKVDSAEGIIKDTIPKIFPTIDIDISNNKAKTKSNSLLDWLSYHPFNKNPYKVSKEAQLYQNSLNDIRDRDKRNTSKKQHKTGKM